MERRTDKPLSKHQADVLVAFEQDNTDYDIAVIYTRVYGDPGEMTARDMQQKLAPIFSTINKKMAHGFIEPGIVKRTYRFTSKGK